MIENGMVVGAAEEWERLNTPNAWERLDDQGRIDALEELELRADLMAEWLLTPREFLRVKYGTVAEVLQEDALEELWDMIPKDAKLRLMEAFEGGITMGRAERKYCEQGDER